jgi:CrcB protein
LGTLAVNIIGSFVLGYLAEHVRARGFDSPEFRSLIFIGFLVALTTFSTFSHETLDLLRASRNGMALWNVGANIGLCLLAVRIGQIIANR